MHAGCSDCIAEYRDSEYQDLKTSDSMVAGRSRDREAQKGSGNPTVQVVPGKDFAGWSWHSRSPKADTGGTMERFVHRVTGSMAGSRADRKKCRNRHEPVCSSHETVCRQTQSEVQGCSDPRRR